MNLFFEVGSLRKVARSHRQNLLTDDLSDNIASHSYRVSVIAYYLAKLEGADPYKTVMMALFHDLPEARSGDQNWIHKKYLKIDEELILKDQLKGVTEDNESYELMLEYLKRESLESKVAKDADLLDQIYLLKEYSNSGNVEAGEWLKSKESEKRMVTKSAKELAKKVYETSVHSWWSKSWTSERK